MYTKQLKPVESVPDNILEELKNNYSKAGGWEEPDEVVKEFKEIMKEELYKNQNGKCAYCELPLETRNPAIEHIAPKGGKKQPKHVECMFLPVNLVYACNNCNSPSCKGKIDTVICKQDKYEDWTFSIVHPYLDNPEEYFEIPDIDGRPGIFPVPKHDADEVHRKKAKKTIDMFGLNGEKNMELAKEWIGQKYASEINQIIASISSYHPY